MNKHNKNKITVSEKVQFRTVNDETVINNNITQESFVLDRMGSRIWLLLQEKHIYDEILNILLTEYDVDKECLRKDMDAFFTEMLSNGLIRINRDKGERGKGKNLFFNV